MGCGKNHTGLPNANGFARDGGLAQHLAAVSLGPHSNFTNDLFASSCDSLRPIISFSNSFCVFSFDPHLGYDPSRIAKSEGAVTGEHTSEGQSDLIQLIERGL